MDYFVKNQISFLVPGRAVGYTRMTQKSKWGKVAQAYIDYKKVVQAQAQRAGLTLPLSSTEDSPIWVDTTIWFRTKGHGDPENVRKGIVDALFYVAPAAKKLLKAAKEPVPNDKWVRGDSGWPKYDERNPRVEVIVATYERQKEMVHEA